MTVYFTGGRSVAAASEKDPYLFAFSVHLKWLPISEQFCRLSYSKLLRRTQSRTPSSVIIHSFVLRVTIVYVTVFPTRS